MAAEPTPRLTADALHERAAALDAADPLAAFRDRFVVTDPDLVYLDGNSLGRLPRATVERLGTVVADEWGGELVRGWDHWIEEPGRVGDLIAGLVGAGPGEVIVSDSTTVNFYKLALAALEARAGPADRHHRPRQLPDGSLRPRGPRPAARPRDRLAGTRSGGWADRRRRRGGAVGAPGDVALGTLTHVNYRSAAIADMAGITSLAHDAGALALWDLCHSAGSIEVDLEGAARTSRWAARTSTSTPGPGAPAFLYVRRALQGQLRNPIQGWFGQRDQFAMAQGYDPAPGITQWLAGTPGVLALAAIEEGVRLVSEAGIGADPRQGCGPDEFAIGPSTRCSPGGGSRSAARATRPGAAGTSRSAISRRAA